jgi:hypothetical protein
VRAAATTRPQAPGSTAPIRAPARRAQTPARAVGLEHQRHVEVAPLIGIAQAARRPVGIAEDRELRLDVLGAEPRHEERDAALALAPELRLDPAEEGEIERERPVERAVERSRHRPHARAGRGTGVLEGQRPPARDRRARAASGSRGARSR